MVLLERHQLLLHLLLVLLGLVLLELELLEPGLLGPVLERRLVGGQGAGGRGLVWVRRLRDRLEWHLNREALVWALRGLSTRGLE